MPSKREMKDETKKVEEKDETKEWTVMFYFATDNPLAPGVISHLKALKNAGYHPQVNVLAQFDAQGTEVPIHVFDVNRMEKLRHPTEVNIGFAPNDSYVRNMVTDKLWDSARNKKIKKFVRKTLRYNAPIPSVRMSKDQDPKRSLNLFLDFCQRRYPARHYMLFLLGHGLVVGGDVFLFDEHGRVTNNGESRPRSLSLTDLRDELETFNDKIKGRHKDKIKGKDEVRKVKQKGELELIGFHSCSMSGAEVAFELKDTANYMLAAQGPQYIGSWPYRQILIRLFNDLSRSVFSKDDLETNGLIDKLVAKERDATYVYRDATYAYMRGQLNGNGARALLDKHVVGEPPQQPLVKAVARKFESVLSNSELFNKFQPVKQSDQISELLKEHEKNRMSGEYLKWLNRQLLLGGLTRETKTAYTKANIKKMLISIFDYCLFNSIDFQLTGYSCDLTLCDLRKVDTLEQPIQRLVSTLKDSLKTAAELGDAAESEDAAESGDPIIRDLLVLAHWEAQSFYEEKYADLYDFCFRLQAKCKQARPSKEMRQLVRNIAAACDDVMEVLQRSSDDHDRLIVRCEHSGLDYQYAHGLSVYFPWSEPVDNQMWKERYQSFKFSRATGWRQFLKEYFKETMRKPEQEENDPRNKCLLPPPGKRSLLALLDDLTTRSVRNSDGQLKIGSRDPLGTNRKIGSLDPMGSECDCGSIKNYPTASYPHKGQRYSRPTVNMFHSFERCFPGEEHEDD